MKKLLLSFILLTVGLISYAQCPLELAIGDIDAVDNGGTPAIEFTIYMQSPGPDFYLADFNMSFTFDHSAFGNPTVEQVTSGLGPTFFQEQGVTTLTTQFGGIFDEIFRGGFFTSVFTDFGIDGQGDEVATVDYLSPFFTYGGAPSSNAVITTSLDVVQRVRITDYLGPVGDPSLANLNWEVPGLGNLETSITCYSIIPSTPANLLVTISPPVSILPDNPLPIELITFQGDHVKGAYNLLTWETAVEEDFSHFELEFGINGTDFQQIDRQAGKAAFGSDYTYEHTAYRGGNNYYRLKMVDLNGNFSYSDIVVINVKLDEQDSYNVFPIPTTGELFVEWTASKASDAQLNVYDVAGKLVSNQFVQAIDGFNRFEIDMNSLAPGSYILRVITADGATAFTEKLTLIR